MNSFKIGSCFVVLVFLTSPGFAQVATSRLEGTIQDVSGAVIAGAKVTAVNNRTQTRTESASGAEGRFVLPSLAPGEYTVTVDSAGFRRFVINNVVLNVGDVVNQNIKLELGQVTESVVVEAEVVRVQTSEAQIARVVTMKDIDTLPQLARNPLVLAVFQPGIQIDAGSITYSHVNGLRQGSNNTRLDGVDVNDPVAPRLGLSHNPNNPDAIAEFRIIINGGKAEYGRSAGGQVEMITRSGTNKWSGNLFEYLRNTALHANTFFNNSTGNPRPKFIQNQFGGSLGGPIRKDKTFIFGNFQGFRQRQEVVRNRTVLSGEAKRGVFRWRVPGSSAIQSFDIARNDPRGKGVDAEVAKTFAMLPDPNNFDLGDTLNTAGFRFNNPTNSSDNQLHIKADHNLTSAHRLFVRYSLYRNQLVDALNNADARFPGQLQGTQGGRRWGYSIGSDWSLTPNIVNEARFGYRAAATDFLRPARPKGVAYISNLYTDPINPNFSNGRDSPVYDITENVTMVRQKHTFKAGANLRFTKQHNWRDDNIYPNVTFATTFGNNVPASIGPAPVGSAISSADRQRFDSLYNDVLGRMNQVTLTFYSDLEKFLPAGTGRVRDLLMRDHAYFFQDDWKILKNLTLNLGLRWEYFGVPSEKQRLIGRLDKIDLVSSGGQAADLKVQRNNAWFNRDLNNFAPRVAFAWDVRGDGKIAVRSSYGVFYDRIIGSAINGVDTTTPGFSQASQVFPNQAGTDRRASDGASIPARPENPVLELPPTRSTTIRVFHPNFRTGYAQHFSLNIQTEVFRNTVLEASYVGTRGVKLFMNRDLNQPRIYEDFLKAFKELQAFQASSTPVPAGNALVRVFGTPAAAISALGASTVRDGQAGSAANTLDRSNYTRYAAAGLSNFYLRNFPQYNQLVLGGNDGRSYYNSLQVSVRRQVGALKVNANYTFSKGLDNTSAEGNGYTAPIDSSNLRLNRARTDFDRPHSFNSSVTYVVPVGKGKRFGAGLPRWADSLAGGWEMGLLNIWQSGDPFTVNSSRTTATVTTWANYDGDRNIGQIQRKGNGVFFYTPDQVARFTFPGAGEIGTSGRNAFRNPRYFDVDISVLKRFRVYERYGFTYRAEFFNLFNNTNFGDLATNMLNQQTFGKFSAIVGNARIMQMALRLDF